MEKLNAYLNDGEEGRRPSYEWVAGALEGSDTVSLALTSNRVLAVCESPRERQIATEWSVKALDREEGNLTWQVPLPGPAVAGGLAVDRDGRILVALEDGRLSCLGSDDSIKELVASLKAGKGSDEDKEKAKRFLIKSLNEIMSPSARDFIINSLAEVGVVVDKEARDQGYVTRWRLLGPVPWDPTADPHTALIGEPNVDLDTTLKIGGMSLKWRSYVTEKSKGRVNLTDFYGTSSSLAAYAYTEINLDKDRDLVLKLGSNDGFVCWVNGEEVGRFDGGRGYVPDQDTLKAKGKKGLNRILVKITQYGNRWRFNLRVLDENEKPFDFKIKG